MHTVTPLGPSPLEGRFITLEPLKPHHCHTLTHLAESEPDTFQYMPIDITVGFSTELDAILTHNAKGDWLSYVVRQK